MEGTNKPTSSDEDAFRITNSCDDVVDEDVLAAVKWNGAPRMGGKGAEERNRQPDLVSEFAHGGVNVGCDALDIATPSEDGNEFVCSQRRTVVPSENHGADADGNFSDEVETEKIALDVGSEYARTMGKSPGGPNPCRQNSTVSSIGNSVMCGEEDDSDEGISSGHGGVDLKPHALFGTMSLDTSTLSNSFSRSRMNDEKSICSESSMRPDPPSILDGQIPRNNLGNGGVGIEQEPAVEHLSAASAYQQEELVMTDLSDYQQDPDGMTSPHDASAHIFALNNVEEDERALATISKYVAELTLQDDDDERVDRNGESKESLSIDDPAWDLDRNALLAESPKPDHKPGVKTASDCAPEETEEMQTRLDFYQVSGPDNLVVLPRVDEPQLYASPPKSAPSQMQLLSFLPPSQHQQQQLQMPPLQFDHMQAQQHGSFGSFARQAQNGSQTVTMGMSVMSTGRRKIRLRLQEEVRNTNSSLKKHFRSSSLLGTIRKSSTRMLRFGGSVRSFEVDDEMDAMPELYKMIDRGSISVSWYEGTSSLELQQHVRKTVIRKLKWDNSDVELDDLRFLDETMDPPEDVVLSPYLPDGSNFLLRFSTTGASSRKGKIKEEDGIMTPLSQYSGRPPLSPSAAPSPHPEKNILSSLNANQLALLNSLKVPTERGATKKTNTSRPEDAKPNPRGSIATHSNESKNVTRPLLLDEHDFENETLDGGKDGDALEESSSPGDDNGIFMLASDDPVESRLREITELLLSDRKSRHSRQERRGEKRQVIFVVANYFVLFLALIAVSAEIQARAPNWLKIMEDQLQSVQNCSENHEALFECVSRGDFAGLIASVLLWLSRSVATKRIFLFGFETPKKLWTVVYESMVTSICWGISYIFIRRGMNPDTRSRFVQRYWKDAVYGSLAGFNASFLKQVLKNLIPEEVVEGALRERQLKIIGWLPSWSFA